MAPPSAWTRDDPPRFADRVARALTATTGRLDVAGLELGLIAFAANLATVVGFQTTTAARGAFLIRLSVVFTALLAALARERLSSWTWAAAALAAAGGALVSFDGAQAASLGAGPRIGDLALTVAALLWSLQTLRLGRHAPHFEPLALASRQLFWMAVFGAAWLAIQLSLARGGATAPASAWGGAGNPVAWLVLLYPALGPWSIGLLLQLRGQRGVSASRAQIIYATDPLWAAVFAMLLGADERHLGPGGLTGAFLIVLALVISGRGRAP